MEEITLSIYNVLSSIEMDENAKKLLIRNLELTIKDKIDLSVLKEKLEVLYNYEKNYLMLVKEFKEEIKFASSIQEDLRKERAKFFAETLKEVSNTLKEASVSNEVASKWVEELVNSYTKSLDLSSGLIEEHTLETIGKLRKDAKLSVKQSELKENE